MEKEAFIENRKKLLMEMPNNTIVILFSGKAPIKTGDEYYQFTPNRNFYYFSGVDEENVILLMKKTDNITEEILFIKEIDLDKERWVGKSIRPFEATNISGIKNIKTLKEFEIEINKSLESRETMDFYFDLRKNAADDALSLEEHYAKNIKNKYPQINIKNITPYIIPLRLIKSNEEVINIQRALDITIKGIKNIMKNSKPFMKEYEYEAYFEFTCKTLGTKDYAFKTIAAAGKNATILHYVDNNSEAKDGDLILFDLGAQYNYYNGDISRTIPVNGRFTERQKQVYNAVLSVNERVINIIKPGMEFKELNEIAKNWIAEECMKLGLIKDIKEVSKYYWHSIGHSLGLETHDLSYPNRNVVFKEGMVWTVEPGIYIEEESIGIRIEDVVLIKKDGAEVLTKGIMKTVHEIEDYMK